jgi:hypothetical protein
MSTHDLASLTAGCRALLFEIVRRAIHDWVLYRSSRRLKNKQLAEEAYHWLFEETEDGAEAKERAREGTELTSFLSICQALDLDPEAVRRRARQLTPKDVLSVGRPPTYRRPQPSTDDDDEDLPSPEDVIDMRDLVGAARSDQESSNQMFRASPTPLRSWRSRFG